MANSLRVHAIIKGKVQGVCFRLETKHAADNNGVRGWVRNLADGSVEAVFEGEKQKVNKVLEWCRRGPAMSRVTSIETFVEPFGEVFADFRITV